MSIRSAILAAAPIVALAITALAPTDASAFADGSVRFHRVAGHSRYPLFFRANQTRLDPYKSYK